MEMSVFVIVTWRRLCPDMEVVLQALGHTASPGCTPAGHLLHVLSDTPVRAQSRQEDPLFTGVSTSPAGPVPLPNLNKFPWWAGGPLCLCNRTLSLNFLL